MVKIAEKYPQWTVICVNADGTTGDPENYCAETLEICLQQVLAMMSRRKLSGWSLSGSGWTLTHKDANWVVLPEDFDPDAKLGVAKLIAAGERALYPQQPVVAKPKKAVAKKPAKAPAKKRTVKS